MRSSALILGLFTLAMGAQAQDEAPTPAPSPRASSYRFVRTEDMGDRAVLGINTSGGSKRDTLGLLISSVNAGRSRGESGSDRGRPDRLDQRDVAQGRAGRRGRAARWAA